MKLPTYDSAEVRVSNDKDSPIDWFIVENEPVSAPAEAKFRRELQQVIDYVEQQTMERIKQDHEVLLVPRELDCDRTRNEWVAAVVVGLLIVLVTGLSFLVARMSHLLAR